MTGASPLLQVYRLSILRSRFTGIRLATHEFSRCSAIGDISPLLTVAEYGIA